MKEGVYEISCISKYRYPEEPNEPDFEVIHSLGFWELKGNIFSNLDYSNRKIEVKDKGSFLESFKELDEFKDLLEYKEAEETLSLKYNYSGLARGEYFKRVYKPVYIDYNRGLLGELLLKSNPTIDFDEIVCLDSVDQLSILIDYLYDILNVLYPTKKNFVAYGFEIRNQILLVCTEIETQFRGVLNANSIHPINKERFNIKDYVRIKDMMKLTEYEVSFEKYPSLGSFKPFLNWNCNNPRISLKWFNSYHSIKHDRVANYEMGNLGCLLNSIIGLYILLLAQYGASNCYVEKYLQKYFRINKLPEWGQNEMYFPPLKDESWKPGVLTI